MVHYSVTASTSSLNRGTVVASAVSLIRRHSDSQGSVPKLSLEARRRLVEHAWTGGVDELDQCIRQALVLCPGEVIQSEHLPLAGTHARQAQSMLLQTLRAVDGVRSEAAKRLGINVRSLRQQLAGLRAQGVTIPDARPAITELRHD